MPASSFKVYCSTPSQDTEHSKRTTKERDNSLLDHCQHGCLPPCPNMCSTRELGFGTVWAADQKGEMGTWPAPPVASIVTGATKRVMRMARSSKASTPRQAAVPLICNTSECINTPPGIRLTSKSDAQNCGTACISPAQGGSLCSSCFFACFSTEPTHRSSSPFEDATLQWACNWPQQFSQLKMTTSFCAMSALEASCARSLDAYL